ncbi:MAG: branched-chain-amino-acid transaminase [Planctomycetota bacterium]
MTQQIYINGKFFSREDAKISVYDHGLLYGDGIFEGMRIYNGKVFRLHDHIVRLYESALAIGLAIPISPAKMIADTEDTVRRNELSDGYIRLVCTRGTSQLGLDPSKCIDPQVIIIADKVSLYPDEMYEKGLELVTASTIRNHPAALSPRIKSLNYLNNIMAKMEGLRAGCIETLMLNHNGEVAECTGDNIFIVKNRVLFTPPVNAGILAGITRDTVIQLAAKMGVETREETMTRFDVFVADECFLTGSAAEVIAVVRLDSRRIGDGKPGKLTRELKQRFEEHVRE